jgi:Ser/Thr protein kinase RdoA (MazF antagonist)
VIVDLDGLCWASPARDAGNFCASLRWKAIREPHHAAFIEHGIASFMDGYASVRTTPDEHWMDRYTAGSMLKIAARRFRKLNVSEWPLIPQLLDEAHELLRRSERTTSAHGLAATLPAPVNLALDAGTMTARLRPLLGWSADDHEAPAVTRAELIGEKPEHRWTFQYRLSGELQQVVGKVYRDKGRGERVHGVLRWLSARAVGVPRALGWIDELSMLAYLPVPGRLLSDRLFSARAPLDMDLTAAWLAALHGSELPLDRTFDVENELKNLREWAAVVSDHYPEHAWAADRIATRLVECAPLLGAETSRPIHKDFHYQHVFVGEQAHVIDLDEVRLGDPAFDLAHFCAYLRLLGCRFPAMAATLERRRDEFLTAYELHARREIGSQFALFYAYTCLKIAKQLCTSRGLSPRPQVEEEHRQTAEMLREGLTALACG